jgi:hypothetical protein
VPQLPRREREEIERAAKVRVRAQDREGKWFELEAEGLLAVAIQHEYDHLQGVLMIDRLGPLKKRLCTARCSTPTSPPGRATSSSKALLEVRLTKRAVDRVVGKLRTTRDEARRSTRRRALDTTLAPSDAARPFRARQGETSSPPTCASSCPSPSATATAACTCWTWSRRATWA